MRRARGKRRGVSPAAAARHSELFIFLIFSFFSTAIFAGYGTSKTKKIKEPGKKLNGPVVGRFFSHVFVRWVASDAL